MSRPIESTTIYTKKVNGVLKGIFISTTGDFQYYDGRITNQFDEKAWFEVPDFTKESGVNESGYYYVFRKEGYCRRERMRRQIDGTVAYE